MIFPGEEDFGIVPVEAQRPSQEQRGAPGVAVDHLGGELAVGHPPGVASRRRPARQPYQQRPQAPRWPLGAQRLLQLAPEGLLGSNVRVTTGGQWVDGETVKDRFDSPVDETRSRMGDMHSIETTGTIALRPLPPGAPLPGPAARPPALAPACTDQRCRVFSVP